MRLSTPAYLTFAVVIFAIFSIGSIQGQEDLKNGTYNPQLNLTWAYNWSEGEAMWGNASVEHQAIQVQGEKFLRLVTEVGFKNMAYKTLDWLGYILYEMANVVYTWGYTQGDGVEGAPLWEWAKILIYIWIIVQLLPVILVVVATIYCLSRWGYMKWKK